MAFWDIFSSHSSSSTTNESVNTSPGLQDVQNSPVIAPANSSIGTVNVTDSEAVRMGILSANHAAETVSNFAAAVLDSQAVENERNRALVGQAENKAINTVKAAGKAVLDFSNTTLDRYAAENEANRAFAGQAVAAVSSNSQQVIGQLSAGFNSAFGQLGSAVDKAFSLVGQGQTQAIGAIQDSAIANLQFVDAQAGRVSDVAASTLNGITNFVQNLLNASDARNTQLITDIAQQDAQSLQVLGEATRSDAAKSLDKVVTFAGLAFGGLLLVTFFSRGR